VKREEIIVGIVIFLFGAATVLLSLRMPIGTFRVAGTGMFPLILGILLMILSGTFVSKIFLQGKERQVKEETSIESSESPRALILFLGTMVLVTLLFNKLGYPLSALLLMLALLRILGVKRWTLTLPLSFMTAVVCYFLFVHWLKIPLPKGWLGI
jgi:putative tricarboxylic transport membrane protein